MSPAKKSKGPVKTVKKKVAATKTTTLPKPGHKAKVVEGTNLIRRDYLLDDRVIIATARAKRPNDFKREPEPKSDPATCPFCPQNQDQVIIADEIPAPGTKAGWSMRSVVNLFSAVTDKVPRVVPFGQGFYEQSPAFGYAEVVIESPDHEKELEDLSVETIASLLKFLGKRVKDLQDRQGVRHVTLFKNRGRVAGASISHSHWQLIATHFVPPRVAEIYEASYAYQTKRGECPYCKIIDEERQSERHVTEDDHAVAFTPFASGFPFELWLFPKRHVPSLSLMTTYELESFARILRGALKQLGTLGKSPYNIVVVADQEYGEFHWHLKLLPRLTTWAGYEFASRAPINPMPPEDAAEFYRKAFK